MPAISERLIYEIYKWFRDAKGYLAQLTSGGDTTLHSHAGSGGMVDHGNEYHTPDFSTFTQTNHDALPNPHHPQTHTHIPADVTGTAVITTDSRLSDARTPTSHDNTKHSTAYEVANSNIQAHVTSAHAPSNAQANADITKAEIEAKLTGVISSHSHTGGSESEITVIKSGDTSNATTTYADATGLTFTALASKTYIIEAWIRYATSATTVGIKFSCNGPTTPVFVSSVFNTALVTSGMSGGGGNAYDTGVATASAFATANNLAMLNILFRNGTTQGAFTIRFAAETTGTVTVKDGSVLRYRQVD